MIFFGCLGLQGTKKNIKYTLLNKKINKNLCAGVLCSNIVVVIK